MEEFITEPRRFFFFLKSLIAFTVVPDALGLQDNLQIIMMVAMRMAEQPVDKASKQFLPLSVWTVLCDGTDHSVRTRKGRRKKTKRKSKQGSWFKAGIIFQSHKHIPNPHNVFI